MHALLHSRCSREFNIDATSQMPGDEVSSAACKVSGCWTCKGRDEQKVPAADTWEFFAEAASHKVYGIHDYINFLAKVVELSTPEPTTIQYSQEGDLIALHQSLQEVPFGETWCHRTNVPSDLAVAGCRRWWPFDPYGFAWCRGLELKWWTQKSCTIWLSQRNGTRNQSNGICL